MRHLGLSAKSRSKRGFTLVEISLVLALSALMVGGVMYALTRSVRGVSLNEGSDELNTIVTNMRSFYSGQNSSYTALTAQYPGHINVDPTNDFCFFTPKMSDSSMQAFPPEMLKSIGGTANIANNLWSQTTTCGGNAGSTEVALACSPQGKKCSTGPVLIVVRFSGLPSSDICTGLMVQNSTAAVQLGLTEIVVNGQSLGPLPAPQSAIANLCGANLTSYTIDWYYTVGG